MTIAGRPRVSGHFLRGPNGALAVVLWQPPATVEHVASVLHVPAFGDEMNKSRRTVALQARALAAQGAAVALLDPSGTGDSAGEFGDATWQAWCADVRYAWAWLASVGAAPRVLWGLRLGALLCADLVAGGALDPAAVLLWQPAISGRAFFRQLLRLPAAQRLGGNGGQDASTRPAREASVPPEIGGYALNPALIAAAEAKSLQDLPIDACPVAWLETAIASPPALSPAAQQVVERWRAHGAQVSASAVGGPSFWSAQEIAEAPELVAASTRSIAALLRASHQSA